MKKIILSILLFSQILSANTFDASLNSELNWTNLYGNTNAGHYNLVLQLKFNAEASIELKQELADPPSADQPGSEPKVCHSHFTVDAGTAEVQLHDISTRKVTTQIVALKMYFSHFDETDVCSTPEQLLNNKSVSLQTYYNLSPVRLDYAAPFQYAQLKASISVFPFSYSAELGVTQNANGVFVLKNLKEQLRNSIKRNNKQGVSSYIYAESADRMSTLSLGSFFTELK